ncbi:MAG: DUF559 domain-containing protein [Candidatus Paceibacterota bacterium]
MARCIYGQRIQGTSNKVCLCGCGEFLPLHIYPRGNSQGVSFSFKKGHHNRGINGFDPQKHLPKLCACGCGYLTTKLQKRDYFNRYIKGHENRGRVAWNKDKPFSLEVRKKMSIARLGKKPANKISVNLEKIKELYIQRKMTRQEVATLLGVSTHVIKMRVRELRGGKLKNPYHSPEFIERMRKVGVELFKRWEQKEGPNKLEQLIYSTLDKHQIEYKKQVPLFDKFIVDVLFPKQKLILEIFGDYWHNLPRTVSKDAWKREFLKTRGYQIEEIWEHEIKQNGAEPVLNKFLTKYNLI